MTTEVKALADRIIEDLVTLMHAYPMQTEWVITHHQPDRPGLVEAASITRRSKARSDAIRLMVAYAQKVNRENLHFCAENYGIRSRGQLPITKH